jgi:acetyl-CoA synthetase
MMAEQIDSLLIETRKFKPPAAFVKQANIQDPKIWDKAARNPEKYWADWAKQLHWFKPFKKVCEWKPPHAKWFLGGKINASYNCLDRHLDGPRRYKAAIIWEGEDGRSRTLTYQELHREVCKFANVLKGLGVGKGDRVTLYMGMVPELVVAALACARIGAPHSVVFGGFSPESIRERVNDCGSKVLVTADGGWRRGTAVRLKHNCDEALAGNACPSIEKVVVFEHVGAESGTQMQAGRDLSWRELMAKASAECPAEPMDSEDILFLLYTSGSTGKPKGIQHATGGYLTGVLATTRWIFDIKDSDLFWCTADIGWVTGHSYVTYGPLLNGATVMIYEGTPDYPDKERFWNLVEKYGVTIFYTAPTAIRTFMKWGHELVDKHPMPSLRLLGSVGEPINPEAWVWYQEHVGKKRCPVADTWWQTETGNIMISPLPGLVPTKPGSATKPFPGTFPEVVDSEGKPVKVGGGFLVYKRPWPGMLRTLWNADERFQQVYFGRFKDAYFAGDAARIDKDGYFWLMGRVDDVVNVSGHRIGTMEVESALVDHPSVAEAAVIGKNHEVKGQALSAFVILKAGKAVHEQLNAELKEHVAKKIGALARPDDIFFTAELPKTRSGKIMRRLLRDIAEGRVLGDTTTLADPTVVASLKNQYEEKEG